MIVVLRIGMDIKHLEYLCKNLVLSINNFGSCFLGHSNNMKEILNICKKYKIYLIEDTCEALGSKYKSFFKSWSFWHCESSFHFIMSTIFLPFMKEVWPVQR